MSLDHQQAPAASKVINRGGNFMRAVAKAFNASGGLRYLHVFDASDVPTNGTAPLFAISLNAGEEKSYDLGIPGTYLAKGIVWASSTTHDTLTLGGSDLSVDIDYTPCPRTS